jgi:sulfur carrier protein ThiS
MKVTSYSRLALDKQLYVLRTLSIATKPKNLLELLQKLEQLNPIVSVWNNGQCVLKSNHSDFFTAQNDTLLN